MQGRTLGLAEATFQAFIPLGGIPTTVFSLFCEQLQVVADVCGCSVLDSQAMLKCLREKSSLELLSLGKVRRDGKFVWVTQKMVVAKHCICFICFDWKL